MHKGLAGRARGIFRIFYQGSPSHPLKREDERHRRLAWPGADAVGHNLR
jgi:hypothetical protein